MVPNAKNVYAELPFEYLDEENNLVRGIMDLVIENKDDKIIVIDYKSNYNRGMSKEEFKEHLYKVYDGQINLYKKTLSENENDVETIIYNKYI